VGAAKSIPVDVRILSATHRNLEEMIKSGQFREDLLFRINVFPIMIPPLRQRREDIPALVHYFIEKKTKELKFGITPKLGPGAIDQLMDYHWPGNVRELENIVERALIRHRDGFLTFENVVSAPAKKVELSTMTDQTQGIAKLDEINAWHIERVLKLTKGKIHAPGGAAELLGIHPNTLRKRMDKLGISYRRHR
jgi:transcriptional regulator with GAF, ATPase, and Fis domain